MKARVVPRIRLIRGKAPTLTVDLPDACDTAAIRDGVEPRPTQPTHGLGERAWWLCQMVAAVPPSTWSETFATSPDALVAASQGSEWETTLRQGWALAARRVGDAAWAEAILRITPHEAWLGLEPRQALMDILPAERREGVILRLLDDSSEPLTHAQVATVLLPACRHAWSPELSRSVLDRVRRTMQGEELEQHWHLGPLLPQLGRSIPPDLTGEVAEEWPTETRAWANLSNRVNSLISLLQFRHEMLTELAS
jgi:hypothetical protein